MSAWLTAKSSAMDEEVFVVFFCSGQSLMAKMRRWRFNVSISCS